MRKILVFFFLFGWVMTPALFGQTPMGEWRLFTPPGKAIDITASSTHVYAALENGLLEREIDGAEKYLWTAANNLSDIDLSTVHYDATSQTLFIGYANGNLDLIKNNTVYNIPALLLANISGNKRYNTFTSSDGFVYAATGVGVIKFDPAKQEVRDTYFPFPTTTAIMDVAFKGDTIFALSGDRVRYGNKNNIALADYTQWNDYTLIPTASGGSYHSLLNKTGRLLLQFDSDTNFEDTLFIQEGSIFSPFNALLDKEIKSVSLSGENLLISTEGTLYELDAGFNQVDIVFQYSEGEYAYPNNAVKPGEDYYIADNNNGLVKARNSFSHEKIRVPGPSSNSYYRLTWEGGKLAVAGGGLSGNQATYNTAGVYLFEDEEWVGINLMNQPEMAVNTWDILSVSVDPNNIDHVVFGTQSGRGLFEVTDGQNIAAWFDENNSPLELTTLGNNMYAVPEVFFDNSSNLWIAQSYSNLPLKVKTKDNAWYEFDLGAPMKSKAITDLAIDFNGIKWVAASGSGVVAFNDNGTIEDPSDDSFKRLTMGEGLGNLPSNIVRSICVDYNNDIWFGTEAGLAILYSADNITEATAGQYDAQQILIQVDEFVEILLGESVITKIVIDGGNRKWIGTEASGVFLLSPDGREEIYRFTAENSPLISNNILDIAIDQNTGEVFFATDKGLVSFRSDASEGDPEFNSVKVFPNPVRPDFTGPVTIQGLAYNSDVKVTDSGGNLVYQTQSNGGTATWNGKTLQGERAKSGVYLIWTADPSGKGRKVGKVVFIN